jgi:hypothetical protein
MTVLCATGSASVSSPDETTYTGGPVTRKPECDPPNPRFVEISPLQLVENSRGNVIFASCRHYGIAVRIVICTVIVAASIADAR